MIYRAPFFTMAILALLWLGCSEELRESSDGGTDGADAGGDGGQHLSWPEESLEIDGLQAAIAISALDTVVLAYENEGKIWVMLDPGSGKDAVSVGDQVGESTWVRAAASPTEDMVLVAWSYARGVWVDASGPSLPAVKLVDSFDVADRLQLLWRGAEPIMLMYDKSGTRAVRVDQTGVAPAPGAAEVILDPYTNATFFNEMPLAADLGSAQILLFDISGEADGEGYGTRARWVKTSADAMDPYYRTESSGLMDLPGVQEINRFWIQVHDLAEDGLVLSWTETMPASQVFDIFCARLNMDADGKPSVVGQAINISNTPGETDNSDHPLVLAAGDGRLWVAWREISFGPRVALLSKDLQMLAITAPDEELNLDETQPISAAVDEDGTLHLVAVVRPNGDPKIRYWRFDLPE